MLEQIGQSLGSDRRLQRLRVADVARDECQLTLDRGGEPARAVVHEWIEASDGSVESLDRQRERTLTAGAVVVERDDLCHASNLSPRV